MAEEVTTVVAPAYADKLSTEKTIRDFLEGVLTGTSKNGLFVGETADQLCAEVDIVWAGNEYWIAYKPATFGVEADEASGTNINVVYVADHIVLKPLSQFIDSGFSIHYYDAADYREPTPEA